MLRREPFLCKLIFLLYCFASLSLADELNESDRLEFTANTSISNTSLSKPREGSSFADIIDKALEKEFTENDQNEGSFFSILGFSSCILSWRSIKSLLIQLTIVFVFLLLISSWDFLSVILVNCTLLTVDI